MRQRWDVNSGLSVFVARRQPPPGRSRIRHHPAGPPSTSCFASLCPHACPEVSCRVSPGSPVEPSLVCAQPLKGPSGCPLSASSPSRAPFPPITGPSLLPAASPTVLSEVNWDPSVHLPCVLNPPPGPSPWLPGTKASGELLLPSGPRASTSAPQPSEGLAWTPGVPA